MAHSRLLDLVSEAGPPGATAISSGHVIMSRRELIDAALKLAECIQQINKPSYLVAAVEDGIATAVVMLTGEQLEIPVFHTDPLNPAGPKGMTVRGGCSKTPHLINAVDRICQLGNLHLIVTMDAQTESMENVAPESQVFLTSGSTGTAVGVIRSTEAIVQDAFRVASSLEMNSQSIVVVTAPSHHNYGFNYGLMAPLMLGARSHFVDAKAIPSQMSAVVKRIKADVLIAHPYQFTLLAKAIGSHAPRFPSLTRAVTAGAALRQDVTNIILASENFELFNCYGSSETGAITLSKVVSNGVDSDVGCPLPGVTISSRPGLDLVRGSELLIKSSAMASGYVTPIGVLPLPTVDGWYQSGDIGELIMGRVHLYGRVGRLINVAGKKVNPDEVERVLLTHPAIEDAQVIGASDISRGEIPVATIVLASHVSTAELLHWCRTRLAEHQVPRHFDVVSQIERTGTGKLARRNFEGLNQ